ncbi:hypothetical protein W97_09102 [Coniosporium apollinis CBS 100218]|uniref:SP-RING-type domain-containing protein n=1 Tax=Coniosporium apollinis (strain CBS 100218) TaxID=1168221 RepID=R7Z747_CONA1|nr:uncharacterized protein W97_09102 [Coniosporium apollinis CBS 100218]EON69839.1 hypothetical protein W97_09102 [Coniosporium apollinis CBS 100218]
MASRQRQSVMPGTPSAQTRPGTIQLPAYEPPSYPLNPAAQRKLANLETTYAFAKLTSHLNRANGSVTNAAGLVNDRYAEKQDRHRRRKSRRQSENGDDDGADHDTEQALEEMRQKVDKMTQRMEESIRKIIDSQQAVSCVQEALVHARSQAAQSITQSTQRTTQRSQRRARPPRSDDGTDVSDLEDDEDWDPTAPGATSTPGLQGASALFSDRLQRGTEKYKALPRGARYAQNQAYVSFRRLVHDAQHPGEDAPPLPAPHTWFPESGAPAPGVTLRSQVTQAEGDSDDDIAIQRERISTKCPLTLKEFVDPVTSRKCPHTFEREAILSLIRQAGSLDRRRGVVAHVQCPVPGCSTLLTANDVAVDQLLVRKIRRIQQSRQREDEDEEDGDGIAGEAESIASDSAEDIDDLQRKTPRRGRSVMPKVESSGVVRRGSGVPPRSTATILDLGSPEDEMTE